MNDDKISQAWDYLIETGIATEQTLQVATSLAGYTLETLESVLYILTGYRSFDFDDDESGEEE